MPDLKQLLTDIARAIVDYPDEVNVTQTEEDNNVLLELRVADSDMGKVIGKQGKIAKSIRLIVKSAANTANKRVTVDIKD